MAVKRESNLVENSALQKELSLVQYCIGKNRGGRNSEDEKGYHAVKRNGNENWSVDFHDERGIEI